MHDSSPDLATASHRRFSAVAIVLHWTIATLIVTNIALAWRFDDLKGLAQFNLIQLHKSIGITVLALSIARLAWRVIHPPPPYPVEMAAWEKAVASLTHWGFYLLMLGLPITGWIFTSASPTNLPTILYKTVHWPHIGFIHALPMGQRKAVTDTFAGAHDLLAKLAYVLIVLHVAAALKHQLFNRDVVLWRMAPLPGLKPRHIPQKEVL